MQFPVAPPLDVTEWLNGPETTLADLKGKVVMLEAFQMLCPGCVSTGLPQAQKVTALADPSQLVVLGVHTVFEHHAAMGRDALEVFISEYRLNFPIAVDRHAEGSPIPLTMSAYGLQGTPSTVLIDRQGRIRHTSFGAVDDFVLGTRIGQLLAESTDLQLVTSDVAGGTCSVEGCS